MAGTLIEDLAKERPRAHAPVEEVTDLLICPQIKSSSFLQ